MSTLVALAIGWAAPAAGEPRYRFRTAAEPAAQVPLAGLLTEQERAFVASLPELRVGVPLPATPPYELIAPDGEISGIHPDMLLALARTLGLRLRPVVLPNWPRTLQAVREREVDIVMTLGVTTQRMEYLAFTLGATPMPGALFARAGTEPAWARARFAVEREYMTNEWVRRQYPQAEVLTVDTTAQALSAVADGRADAYLGSLLEVTELLRQQPAGRLEVKRLVNFGTGYHHFGVRKDLAPLAAILNHGIQTLRTRTSDELAAVLAGLPAGGRLPALVKPDEAGAALLAARPVWRVGAVRGLEPLNGVDEFGSHTGIAAEYTEQVAQRLGVGTQLLAFDSVAAMLDAAARGDVDLVPFLTRTPERGRDFIFSAPYLEMPYMLVARTDGPLYWNLASLAGKRVALAQRHPLRETLAEHYPDIRIVEAPTGQGAMDLVAQGDADAAVEVKLFANLRINSDSAHLLRTVAEVSELPAQFHFAVARANPAMLRLVDQALDDIAPAERERMLRRWVAVDLRAGFPWRRHAPLIAVGLSALLALAALTVWWAQRLRAEVLRRRRTENLLNDMATTVPGMAFRYVLNADHSIRHHFFTPGSQDFLGVELDPKRTVLDTMAAYMRPDQVEAARKRQMECLHTGERYRFTAAYRQPDGSERWMHVEAVQTRSSGGRAVWTGYIVDVSTEHALQARLAEAAESRNLMLASASHELRAPAHTLSLALQALPREGLSADQARTLATAQGATQLLADLLDDVLDAARSPDEPLRLRPRTFDLHQLLEDVANAWRVAARSKGLGFALVIDPALPRTVTLDGLRLKQVLTNLLSNACKYTPAGHVALQAAPEASGALCFVVSDSGIGIDPAQHARVFEPYTTLADPALPPPAGGSSGLGLATCRRIADLMHGHIELDSQPGRGTRVSFSVCSSAVPQPVRPDEGVIVVCDDDATSRLLTAHMLRREGFEVAEAGDAGEALALWRGGGVRALVSDLDMPGMGGLELIRLVRAEGQGQGQRTPVVVCSGSPVPATEPGAPEALYDAYIVKPFEVSTLAATLRGLGVAARP